MLFSVLSSSLLLRSSSSFVATKESKESESSSSSLLSLSSSCVLECVKRERLFLCCFLPTVVALFDDAKP